MKLIDFVENIIESKDLRVINKVKNFLRGNESLLPPNLLPYTREEALEARDMLVEAETKLRK